jgi:chaperonin cofactor prefoldin
MGLIWDMIQHGQIQRSQQRADSLEARVAQLEDELRRTNETLMTLLRTLEQRFGEDLDGDGRVG